MFSKHSVVVLVVVLLAVGSVMSKSQKMRRIASGLWGGEHINMKVGAKSAAIEYDCASGVIDGPLVFDRDGNFNLHGIHRMEHGGPVRADEKPNEQPATYTGSIKGHTMTLTVKVAGSEIDTFTLEKGKPGELFKCK